MFCGKTQLPQSLEDDFPQNFHTRKSGEIRVFYAVTFLDFADVGS